MKYPEIAKRLDFLNTALGNKALGYRFRRELKKIVNQYEKDIELAETFYHSRDRQQLAKTSHG
jgi:hypothetical protein